MNEFNGVEIVEENTLEFSEPYKDWEPSAVEDTYAEWTPKLDSKSDDAVCTRDDENVDFDYKQRAVKFWRSGMKKSNRFKSAIYAGMIIHDVDLQKWGLHAKNILGFEDTRFKASDWWVWKFKRTHRITSRKVNEFITRKTLEDREKLKVNAENFVNEVKPYITQYERENVYNLDQSGFQLEMHSGRTLAIEGCDVAKFCNSQFLLNILN